MSAIPRQRVHEPTLSCDARHYYLLQCIILEPCGCCHRYQREQLRASGIPEVPRTAVPPKHPHHKLPSPTTQGAQQRKGRDWLTTPQHCHQMQHGDARPRVPCRLGGYKPQGGTAPPRPVHRGCVTIYQLLWNCVGHGRRRGALRESDGRCMNAPGHVCPAASPAGAALPRRRTRG